MFRAGIIALLVILVAGCGPSKTRKAFNSSQDSARQLEASGIITESEKYRRFLAAFNALPARDKRGQGHNAAYYEQMMNIAKAYEGKQISTAQYLELKQQADTYKSTRDAEYLRAARARSDAFGKSLNEAVKSLNQQQPNSNRPAAFFKREYTSGFNKICVYDRMGSEEAYNYKNTDICPQMK